MTASPGGPAADARGSRRGDVRRPQSGRERVADGRLDRRGLGLESERVPQQHRRAEDRAERIGDAAARDVGRRAVDRFVQADASSRRATPTAAGPSEPASIDASSVRMSPNMFSVSDHVEAGGPAQQVHRGGVDQHVLEPHLREIRSPSTRSTTERHRRDVSSTFALSTDVIVRRRPMARRPATRVDALDLGRRSSCRRPRPRTRCGSCGRSRCRRSARAPP